MSLIPEGMFENDGCTFWFDNWFGLQMSKCCDVHDNAYAVGHGVFDFFHANFNLMICGFQMNAPGWSILAFCGVSIGGAIPFFFGHKKDVKVITVYDPAQGNNSLRDGAGSPEAGSPSEANGQERK